MFVSRTMSAGTASGKAILVLDNVSKIYQHKVVLQQVSFAVDKGEIFGLAGTNGAGKTSLLKILAGLSRPAGGTVSLFGSDGVNRQADIKRRIAWVPQESNLEKELTVKECLTLYAWLYGVPHVKQRVTAIMAEFHLADLAHQPVETLSGGMARRVLIARAMLPEPELLLLDEPTVGLDPDIRQEIWQLIRKLAAEGKTILMTTHYMDEAEQLCGRLALLKAGKVMLTGTPEDMKKLAQDQIDPHCTLEKAVLLLLRRGEIS